MLKLPDEVQITEELLQTARNMGLRRLTRSPMSRYQFEQYLLKRNVPLEVVTQVATRFEEIKLLDEALKLKFFNNVNGTLYPTFHEFVFEKTRPDQWRNCYEWCVRFDGIYQRLLR